MRRLSSKELYDGMFVQTSSSGVTIYRIIIKDGIYFYSVKDEDWEMNGELVKDNWYETPTTIAMNRAMNRERKLKEIGIDC